MASLLLTHGQKETFGAWTLSRVPGTEGYTHYELIGDPARTIWANLYWSGTAATTRLDLRIRDEALTGTTQEYDLQHQVFVPGTNDTVYSNYRLSGSGTDIGYPAWSERNMVMVRAAADGAYLDFSNALCATAEDTVGSAALNMRRGSDGAYYSEVLVPVLHVDAQEDLGLESQVAIYGQRVLNMGQANQSIVKATFRISTTVMGSMKAIEGKVERAMLISALISDEELSRGTAVTAPAESAVYRLGLGVTPQFQPKKETIPNDLKKHRMWIHSGHGSFSSGLTMLSHANYRWKVTPLKAPDVSGLGLTYRLVFMNTCHSTDKYSVYVNGAWQPLQATNVATHAVLDIGNTLNAQNYIGWNCSVDRAVSILVPDDLIEFLNRGNDASNAVKEVKASIADPGVPKYELKRHYGSRLNCVRSDGTKFDYNKNR
jgi:hypothetical protein